MKAAVFAIVLAVGWLALAGVGRAADDSLAAGGSSNNIVRSKDSAKPLPSGEELIARILSRSTNLMAATNHPVWTYDKDQLTLTLDDGGKVEKREEKFYRVEIINGLPFSRLVRIGGRDLSPAEIKKEDEREQEFQKGLSGRDPKKSADDQEALITTNVADLFEYKVLRREPIHGHSTIVVSFDAKKGKGDNSMADRLMRAMAGTVWVDEDTADVARLEVKLNKSVSFGVLGMLGSIKEFHMDMESTPMADGTWLAEKTDLSFAARIFISGVRMKMVETSTNFVAKPASEIKPP